MTTSASTSRADGAGTAATALPVSGIDLPLRFVLMGVLCLFTGIGLLTVRPTLLTEYHYNQYIIATTHLFVLGWISSIVMGAMYQLVPVAFETKLHSERLARWHFAFHLVGVLGMVAMFWVWNMKQVGHFGSIFAIGVLVFVYNIGRTLRKIRRWDPVAAAVASGLSWLLVTMLVGLFLAAAKCWPINLFAPLAQMHAHAHAGVLGFFVITTVGISYKLIPMFTLSEMQSERRAWASIWLLNVGLAGEFPAILLESRWKVVFALIIAAGLALYGLEIHAMVRARKRPSLDWGVTYFLTAICLLSVVTVLGCVLSWPGLELSVLVGQLENLYGFLAVIGVLSFAIVGMLYKIVPFLVWYASYSKSIGRSKVPALADLYSARVQACGYWLFVGGLLASAIGIVLARPFVAQGGCGLLAASLGLFAFNLACMLRHLFRPTIAPFGQPAVGQGRTAVAA
jgi:hypothetical protein